MTVYYKTDQVILHWADTIECLKTAAAQSIDLIYADPPYFLSNGGITCQNGHWGSVHKGEWDQSKGYVADYQFTEAWITECWRILKDEGTLWISANFRNLSMVGTVLERNHWKILNNIIWVKPNPPPNLCCQYFTFSHENIIWAKKAHARKHRFNYSVMKNEADGFKNPNKQMKDVWLVKVPSSAEKQFGKHSCQKPVALIERIIKAGSNVGDIILDPFCGSGTTGVAALNLQRKFIGIDNNENYLKQLAIPRLKLKA